MNKKTSTESWICETWREVPSCERLLWLNSHWVGIQNVSENKFLSSPTISHNNSVTAWTRTNTFHFQLRRQGGDIKCSQVHILQKVALGSRHNDDILACLIDYDDTIHEPSKHLFIPLERTLKIPVYILTVIRVGDTESAKWKRQ